MPELLFLKQPTTASALFEGVDTKQTDKMCLANQVLPGTALPKASVFSLESDSLSVSVRNQLNRLPPAERQCIASVAEACGDETAVLAAFFDRHFSEESVRNINAAVNAGSTAAGARLDPFQKAVVEYQKSLNRLRGLVESGKHGRGHSASVIDAKQAIRKAYAKLAQAYAIELQNFSPAAHRAKNRGTAFSNAERGITLATRKPKATKPDVRLNVEGQLQASQIARLGKLMNHLGSATIGLDAGLRSFEVYGIAQDGGDWMQAAAREMTGFGLGTASGIGAGRMVFAGSTYIVVQAGLTLAGPFGWLVLGGIFAASVASGYYISKFVDEEAKELSNSLMRNIEG